MAKSPDAFRTISEVADWLGVQAHVLRFWESKFSQVKPVKRAGGRRYYRPADMLLLGGIKKLLHDDGITIKGVQKLIREQGVTHISSFSQALDQFSVSSKVDAQVTKLQTTDRPSEHVIEHQPAPTQPRLNLEPTQSAETASDGTGQVRDDDEMPSTSELSGILRTLHVEESQVTEPIRSEESIPSPVSEQDQPVASTSGPAAEASDTEPRPDIATDATADEHADQDPKPRIIHVADIPADDAQPCPPGPVSKLARISALDAQTVQDIVPLAQALQTWLDRQSSSGAG